VARRLFAAAIRRLPVSVVVQSPDGHRQVLGLGGPVMTVRQPDEFFARLGRHGLIGFGEAYLTEAWDADDVAGFLAVLAADLPTLVPSSLQQARALVVARPPRAQWSTTANSRSNIAHHYDLSNDLFATFLDETLSYSSALFATPIREHDGHLVALPPDGEAAAEPLAEAQARKVERLLDRTGVGAGTRLLEIGTGWGELAIRAAHRGAIVRSVTLSTEQLDLARTRVAAAGVADRVQVELRDYRSIEERAAYDSVVSVEMIEAVGHQFWPEYFGTLDRLLAPGGRVGIQAILMPHDRMLATRRTHTWINKYIFPGGFLPSVEAIDRVTREHTTLHVAERLSFGSHYAETLRRWDEAFGGASARVRELGFDATFERMWHFYLEYSRAGFASGYLDVEQIILER
jgi:cyclopropane-fatty-acyl-phospholipid synthase